MQYSIKEIIILVLLIGGKSLEPPRRYPTRVIYLLLIIINTNTIKLYFKNEWKRWKLFNQ